MSDAQQTITAEGRTVAEAVAQAAAQLGVDPTLVEHKLDLSHFKTADGRSRPVDTVKVIAWARNPTAAAGAVAGRDWVRALLGHMDIEGTVAVRVDGDKIAEVRINSPRARHLVGRQGTNLRAISLLLDTVMAKSAPGWTFRISVDGGEERRADDRPRDDRPRDDRRDDRPRRDDRARDDRPRDDRPRRDDRRDDRPRRDDRRDDRPRRDDRRDDRPRRDDRGEGGRERDLDKLRELARKLAQECEETQEPVRLRRPLNSYERRAVHMEIASFPRLVSESEGEGSHKSVLIRPRTAEDGEPVAEG